MTVKILSWDYREQPDLEGLAQLVRELSAGRVHIVEADTQSDQYAIAIADEPLDKAAATEAYEQWFYSDEEECPF